MLRATEEKPSWTPTLYAGSITKPANQNELLEDSIQGV
jgi:hypothetical protein